MDAYIYKAAFLCEFCAEDTMDDLADFVGPAEREDSDHWPQGPYADGGGESDTPAHCDYCEEFLENPLTADGYRCVREAVREAGDKTWRGEIVKTWAEFYGIGKEEK